MSFSVGNRVRVIRNINPNGPEIGEVGTIEGEAPGGLIAVVFTFDGNPEPLPMLPSELELAADWSEAPEVDE